MRRGTRVGQAYVAITADGSGINKDIVDDVDDAGKDIGKSGDRAGKDYGDNFGDRLRETLEPIMEKMGDRLSKRLNRSVRDGLNSTANNEKANGLGARLGDRIGEAMGERLEEQISGILDRADELAKSGGGSRGGGRGGGSPVSGNQSGDDDRFNLDIGRLFGKDSRNNFLNILGKGVGGLTSLMAGLTKGTVTFVKTFSEGMAQAGEGASLLTRLGSGAGASFGKLGASAAAMGPAIAGAFVLVTIAATVLMSVLSALLAIVVALSATIVSALVGAAAVGAGALLAVVAAGGLLTAAFMSMTNAQKDMLASAFTPLKEQMVGIGQIMLTEMVPAFQVWSENLQRALLLLAPVAQVMGSAFAQAGTALTAAFSGPGFQAMSVALGTFLPSIIHKLSRALGSFLNGTMGLFAAIMPMVDRFAGYLAKVADRFSTWANSAKGQNAIEDFVNRAIDSFKSLWNFTREFFGFLGDLLFSRQAQKAGNSMFDSMTKAFQTFRKAVARAIANGDLEKWFNMGIELGSALWSVVKALGKVFMALESSGVLAAIAGGFKFMALMMEGVAFIAAPIITVIDKISESFGRGAEYIAAWNQQMNIANMVGNAIAGVASQVKATYEANNPSFTSSALQMPNFNFNAGSLQSSGLNALNNTYESSGGYMPDPKSGGSKQHKKQYKNPYSQWAQQFIDSGPSMARQIKQAIKNVNRQFNQALSQAAKAIGAGEARSIISASIQSAKDVGKAMVESARNALSSAAQSLASASSGKEAARALKEVRRMQDALKSAIKAQNRIEKAMARVGKQKSVTGKFVKRLLEGDRPQRATLADYAAAREKLARKIEVANQKLADAIAMRKDYKVAVVDAVKAFGSLLTAQAQTIDGVEQALTAADITSNLQTRLDQIRKFQENLRKLLALGLSNDAYKQLVDAGVEAGGAYAEALIEGGVGAIADVNDLTDQINAVAASLGKEASDRLYKAGVQTAQGIVDGLEARSDWLEAWAKWLGKSIAYAVEKALNGGGGKKKKNNSGGSNKKATAGSMSARVAVSPEVAAYAAQQGKAATVSGNNQQMFRDLIVKTPTEDPKAVALETVNEITGRL